MKIEEPKTPYHEMMADEDEGEGGEGGGAGGAKGGGGGGGGEGGARGISEDVLTERYASVSHPSIPPCLLGPTHTAIIIQSHG